MSNEISSKDSKLQKGASIIAEAKFDNLSQEVIRLFRVFFCYM